MKVDGIESLHKGSSPPAHITTFSGAALIYLIRETYSGGGVSLTGINEVPILRTTVERNRLIGQVLILMVDALTGVYIQDLVEGQLEPRL